MENGEGLCQGRDGVSGQEGRLLRDRFGPVVRLSGGKGLTREGAASPRGRNVQTEAEASHERLHIHYFS